MKRALIAYLLPAGTIVVQALHYYPRLPPMVASHFGAGGLPDDWISRKAFLACELGTTAALVVLFLGIEWALRKIPASWVNMPNKDYWLAPERREDTMARLASPVAWIGGATLVFLAGVSCLASRANLQPKVQMSNAVWPLLGLYLVFIIACVVRNTRQNRKHFSRLPVEP